MTERANGTSRKSRAESVHFQVDSRPVNPVPIDRHQFRVIDGARHVPFQCARAARRVDSRSRTGWTSTGWTSLERARGDLLFGCLTECPMKLPPARINDLDVTEHAGSSILPTPEQVYTIPDKFRSSVPDDHGSALAPPGWPRPRCFSRARRVPLYVRRARRFCRSWCGVYPEPAEFLSEHDAAWC